jgi:hypothetical protein
MNAVNNNKQPHRIKHLIDSIKLAYKSQKHTLFSGQTQTFSFIDEAFHLPRLTARNDESQQPHQS